MFGRRDFVWLIELARVWQMPHGWQVVIRAEWCDSTSGRPYGLSYALILQDEGGERLLGFDNSHGFDGAGDDDPFDHEHRLGLDGQRFRYQFTSPAGLVNDFFDRVKQACAAKGIPFEFKDDE
jgi:hypothetical protein